MDKKTIKPQLIENGEGEIAKVLTSISTHVKEMNELGKEVKPFKISIV